MSTQSKLAGYIGVERPHILAALGLLPDDLTGLDQLWEQFAQLAATGTVGEGKTLLLVDELPAEGDENTYYGLKEQVESDKGPVENPQAGVGFSAILNLNPDLSSVVIGGSGTATALSGPDGDILLDLAFSAVAASSFFENVTEGENSTTIQIVETFNADHLITLVFIDDNEGTVVADGVSYPRGLYFTQEENSTDFAPWDVDEETVETQSAGVYTLDQDAIDAGFYALLTAFDGVFKRGIYGFDGANFNLQLDLTDFSALIEQNVREIASLRSDVEDLMAWKQEIEAAAGAANAGA